MNADVFDRMKSTAFFLNHSRGGLVDEDDLYRALTTGRIAGAALDVGRDTDDDMPPLRLANLGNVIATPHIGGMTPEAMSSQAADTVAQVADVLAGRMPKYAVNHDRATRFRRRASSFA
jgi:D-3-phosphoglycerate dehydrogenase